MPTPAAAPDRCLTALLVLAATVSAHPAGAQTWPTVGGSVGVPAATVPVTDPATGLVDQLLALVPVPGGMVGQRPYSTREVVRVATAVRRELARRDRVRRVASASPTEGSGEARAATLAQALLDAYAPSEPGTARAPALTLRPLDFAWAHAVGSGETPYALARDNGLGQFDARTLPALDLRFGRPAERGVVASVETAHALGVGGWLALVAQPRASLIARYDGGFASGTRWNVEPQRLYARVVARNVALQAGLDEWAWGQSREGGVFLAGNGRPLRALSLQSDTAFTLPWRLRGLGRWRASFFVADLGRDQNFPHAKLAAYKLNLSPRPRLELGAGIMSQFGGRGAPPMSTLDRAADLFPFIGWLSEGSDLVRSNKLANFEARVRVPEWRGLSVAYELTIDDFDLRRPRSTLWEDSGNLLALSVPRLARDGALALDLRAQRTGLRQYRHYQFLSGVTYRGQLLGAPLGSNAGALSAALTWRPAPFDALTLALTGETRDPSVYTNVNRDPNGTLIFERVEPRPVERRLRAAAGWERGLPGRGTSASARLGVERATNRAFVAGITLTRPFGEAGVRVRF